MARPAMTRDVFIAKAKNIHPLKPYLYSSVVWGGGVASKVQICCEDHGPFEITAQAHLQGRGCKKCGELERQRKRSRKCYEKALDDLREGKPLPDTKLYDCLQYLLMQRVIANELSHDQWHATERYIYSLDLETMRSTYEDNIKMIKGMSLNAGLPFEEVEGYVQRPNSTSIKVRRFDIETDGDPSTAWDPFYPDPDNRNTFLWG